MRRASRGSSTTTPCPGRRRTHRRHRECPACRTGRPDRDPTHTLRAAASADAPLQCVVRPRQGIRSRTNKLNHADTVETAAADRRNRNDRRKHTFRSLIHGSFSPRRRGARREDDHSFVAVDWHHPQWLAVAMLTLLLSMADAFLTLTLLERGAERGEPLHGAAGRWLATGLCHGEDAAHFRRHRDADLAGRVRLRPGARQLSSICGTFAYAALVGYEFWLLETLFQAP